MTPRPSFLVRISTLVMLAASGALLSLAAIAGNTPDATQALPGAFNPRQALELLYGMLQTKGDAALRKPSQYDCHACEPGIGAATFTQTAEGWRLDARSPYIRMLGGRGKLPGPGIVKVGPKRYGVVFASMDVGQGYLFTTAT